MSNDLSRLMCEYFQDHDIVGTGDMCLIDVLPQRAKSLDHIPVQPKSSVWEVVKSPNRLMRTFEFGDFVGYKMFLDDLLMYQEEIGHHGQLTLQAKKIIVEVYTHGVDDITEIDKEYAYMADAIYEDAKILETEAQREGDEEFF